MIEVLSNQNANGIVDILFDIFTSFWGSLSWYLPIIIGYFLIRFVSRFFLSFDSSDVSDTSDISEKEMFEIKNQIKSFKL